MSLKMEVVSAMILLLLMRYIYEEKQSGNGKKRWFQLSLWVSLSAILVDILSVWLIRRVDTVPIWLNMLVSSVYFFLITFAAGVIVLYLINVIFEHTLRKKCIRIATAVVAGLLVLELIIIIFNYKTRCLFYFENDQYYRGAWNFLGYAIVFVEICMVICCYLRNRENAPKNMCMVMKTMPFIALALIGFQLLYRDVLMNGMIAAAANLIIFISFQNNRLSVDSLTNLGNRRAFVEQLDVWTRTKEEFHVVLICLNGFGSLNRKYGQKNGDEFLYAVSRYLESLSKHAHAFRVGSMEFAVLCSGMDCSRKGVCTEMIRKRFEQSWALADMEYHLTVSCADLIWEGQNWDGQNWDGTQIIEKLEYALQIAKNGGAGSHVRFAPEIEKMMERQKYVREQMWNAIQQRSYEVYYQPVYCWKEEVFCSAEALARLRDQNGEMIYPGEFIPIAEATGMIREITWIIVEKVCMLLSAHPEIPLKAVSINMPIQQFMEEHMPEKLLRILDRYGVDHNRICIEITERIVSENPEKTRNILESLIEKGIRFYLDDFGVGYSNFSTILSMPFDTIKIDKTLIDKLMSDGKERMITDSVIGMLTKTDYNLVAEGAETAEVVEELKKLQVDRIQGYYYSRPLPEEKYLAFMQQNNKKYKE